MGITTRLIRLFKADIHGVMDQLEDKGLLLKQSLRDMEDALAQKETRLGRVLADRNQTQQACEKNRLEINKFEQDLAMALKKDKDEIARMLIRKILPLNQMGDGLKHHMDQLDQEIVAIKDCIDQQRMQYEQVKHRARQYFHESEQRAWNKTNAEIDSDHVSGVFTDEEIEIELLHRKEALSKI